MFPSSVKWAIEVFHDSAVTSMVMSRVHLCHVTCLWGSVTCHVSLGSVMSRVHLRHVFLGSVVSRVCYMSETTRCVSGTVLATRRTSQIRGRWGQWWTSQTRRPGVSESFIFFWFYSWQITLREALSLFRSKSFPCPQITLVHVPFIYHLRGDPLSPPCFAWQDVSTAQKSNWE